MHTINLYQYIYHGMIMKNLAENDLYDAVIYQNFANTEFNRPENITFHQLTGNSSHSLSGQLLAYQETYDRLLVILHDSHIQYLLPFLDIMDSSKKVTFVNLGTGISGYIHKGSGELHDIGLISEYGLAIQEAFDFVSFFKLLQHEKSSYIRVPERELPGNLLQGEDVDISGGLISLIPYGLTGSQGTIVCAAGQINDMIQAAQVLEKEGQTHDVFLLTDYHFTFSEELQSSLHQTEKLIIVLDQAITTSYRTTIKAKLFDSGLWETEVQFITPLTDKLTTHHLTHLYEQAQFDIAGLVERLL